MYRLNCFPSFYWFSMFTHIMASSICYLLFADSAYLIASIFINYVKQFHHFVTTAYLAVLLHHYQINNTDCSKSLSCYTNYWEVSILWKWKLRIVRQRLQPDRQFCWHHWYCTTDVQTKRQRVTSSLTCSWVWLVPWCMREYKTCFSCAAECHWNSTHSGWHRRKSSGESIRRQRSITSGLPTF